MTYLLDFFSFLFGFIFSIWWLLLPFLLFFMVWDKYITTIRYRFAEGLKWTFLEIQIPTGVKKSPRSMEEVFNALHGVYRGGNWWRWYIDGFKPPYFVFEMIGHNGILRFYVRTQLPYKDLVKSRIYSQYPEAKVIEVEDPLKILPQKIPNPTYDIFGTEVRMPKISAYPIKTYEIWEKLPEEQQIDPVSILSEGATQLSDQEWIIVQIYGMPVYGDHPLWGNKWVKEGEKEVRKLIGRAEEVTISPLERIGEFVVNLLLAMFREPKWKEAKKPEEVPMPMMKLTPRERERLELIEKKMSKLGYWCVVRWAYIGKKDIFDANMPKNTALLSGYFSVFATQDMNSLPRDVRSITTIDKPATFYDEKIFFRKRYLWAFLRGRWDTEWGKYVLTTDELASLYHIPHEIVAPTGVEKILYKEKPPPTETL